MRSPSGMQSGQALNYMFSLMKEETRQRFNELEKRCGKEALHQAGIRLFPEALDRWVEELERWSMADEYPPEEESSIEDSSGFSPPSYINKGGEVPAENETQPETVKSSAGGTFCLPTPISSNESESTISEGNSAPILAEDLTIVSAAPEEAADVSDLDTPDPFALDAMRAEVRQEWSAAVRIGLLEKMNAPLLTQILHRPINSSTETIKTANETDLERLLYYIRTQTIIPPDVDVVEFIASTS